MHTRVGCRYSETLQAAEVKKHVWALTFGLAARLAYAAACVGDISMLHAGAPLASPLLAPLNVLLQWMATQHDIFRCTFCSPSLEPLPICGTIVLQDFACRRFGVTMVFLGIQTPLGML